MKRSVQGSRARARRRQRGISLVEVVIAAAVIGVALLSHAATTLAGHRLTVTEENRSIALEFVREFIERMRADEDWSTVWERCKTKAAAVETGGGAGMGGVVGDGRPMYDVSQYYTDLDVPLVLRGPKVLVQVPYLTSGGTKVLREDAAASNFGLPYDLNGDGVVDSTSHAGDYVALPVVVTFRWTGAGDVEQTIRVATWLRGER